MRQSSFRFVCMVVALLSALGCGDDGDGTAVGGTAGSGGFAASGGFGGAAGIGGEGGGGTGGEVVRAVAETPLIGTLTPYNDAGATLFEPGSVEAHWYRWEGFYIVLYRGYDASDLTPICPGSELEATTGFVSFSNAPYPPGELDACTGAAVLTANAASCGSLLYYATEIPITGTGNLWGKLELSTAAGFIGQTTFGTATITPITDVPEFEPGLTAYDLPEATVDPAGIVSCAP